jgi:hypothetical protein
MKKLLPILFLLCSVAVFAEEEGVDVQDVERCMMMKEWNTFLRNGMWLRLR